MKIKLKAAKILGFSKNPGEEGVTDVLYIGATLTKTVADQIGCSAACFDERGVPAKMQEYKPLIRIDGADVTLGDRSPSPAAMIRSFSIKRPKSNADNDVSLQITFRMHFPASEHIGDFVDTMNKAEFPVEIGARQEDLNFGGEDAEEDTEGPMQEAITLAPAAVTGGTHQRKRTPAGVQ